MRNIVSKIWGREIRSDLCVILLQKLKTKKLCVEAPYLVLVAIRFWKMSSAKLTFILLTWRIW